jgi:hypothetical protein
VAPRVGRRLIRRVPITLRDARAFIGAHHRHNLPPVGWMNGVAVEHDGTIIAVGVLGRPTGRGSQDGYTAEITRVCTIDNHNAASMIYGALCRAAEALGYTSVITYTLAEEDGTSVRAAGFVLEAELPARERWDYTGQTRVQTDLFGQDRRPPGPKNRWRRTL